MMFGFLARHPDSRAQERCADRRQANAKADLAHVASTAHAAGALQGLQFAEHAPHMLHHGPSTGRQADPGMPTLEQRQPELVFEPRDTAADRRGADARGLGRSGEVAGRRRSRQIFEVTDLHRATSAFAYRPEPEWAESRAMIRQEDVMRTGFS